MRALGIAKSWWKKRFDTWVDKRNPVSNTHKLTSKNLYIFPTRQGWLFLVFVLVLWLLGTNYQNNLILGLTFLLISLFVVTILHTYANMAGIEVVLKGASHAYQGEVAEFFFFLSNKRGRTTDAVSMCWQGEENKTKGVALPAQSVVKVAVKHSAERRGRLKPRRLLLESRFPLGILRCWTWLRFDAEALVFPKPIEIPLNHSTAVDDEGDGEHPVKGGEDFSSLNEYKPGDSLKHIAWKLYANERGLFTKAFSYNTSREIWLDFFHIRSTDTELRLSALCFWALAFHQQDENYGLLLPGLKISPDKGENHKAKVLEALACYDSN